MATAATTESISAKLRKDEKDRFSRICDEIGTSPSNAIRMFVSAFNRRGGFPCLIRPIPMGLVRRRLRQWMMR